MNVLSRDDAPRHREQAPYEQRFYPVLLARQAKESPWLSLGLGALSLGSVLGWGWCRWAAWWPAALHALGLAFVLASHELAHAAMARRHGIPLRRPAFVPFPWLGGTLGAFLRPASPFKTRADWFDVSIAGPAAGLASSLLLGWLAGGLGSAALVAAAEQGCFLAFLNLLPISPGDGGHWWSSLLRRRVWTGSLACVFGALGLLAASGHAGWLPWLVLLLGLRPKVAPPLNPFEELSPLRWLLAVCAWLLLPWLARPWPFS